MIVMKGWPDSKEQTPAMIQEYWNFHEEITIQDEILHVPVSLRADMLKQLKTAVMWALKAASGKQVIHFSGQDYERTSPNWSVIAMSVLKSIKHSKKNRCRHQSCQLVHGQKLLLMNFTTRTSPIF